KTEPSCCVQVEITTAGLIPLPRAGRLEALGRRLSQTGGPFFGQLAKTPGTLPGVCTATLSSKE
ncbi:MAG: hypothetical protein WBL98_01250, partial [Pseudolabrys sp.]